MALSLLGLFALSSLGQTVRWSNWARQLPSSLSIALACAVALSMTGSLVFRRINQPAMTALVAVGGFAHLFVFNAGTLLYLTVPLAMYAAARWGSGRLVVVSVVLGFIAPLIGAAVWLWPIRRSNLSNFAFVAALCCAVLMVGFLLGRSVRSRAKTIEAESAAAIQAHEAEMERRAQASILAQARVRAEIARELHDVVAHSLSVMVVQAEGGQAQAAKNPAAAGAALKTIATVGRQAMDEMRHIVGVLRDDDPEQAQLEVAPHPTLSDIPDMVAKAGPRVTLTITGEAPTVGPTVHVVAFRVVQESVTNFLKHAGPGARAEVQVKYLADAITITVTDDGQGDALAAATGDGAGHGMQGMRERLLSVGGHLLAGPGPDGGFKVRAWLPVVDHSAEAWISPYQAIVEV